MTPREYGERVDALERRVDHDLNTAMARAMNAGPGSGAWTALGDECREIGRLADEMEGEVR